ncbi:hypothetical protein ABTK95_19730, partial [Acinetobacter baumannii]
DKRLLAELDAALNDRTLGHEPPQAAQLARLVEQAPELAEAYVALYQRHQRLQDEHAQLIDRFYGEQGRDPGTGQPRAWAAPLPHEEVR